jgi:hypothetical protein
MTSNYIEQSDICQIYGDELAKDIFPFVNKDDDTIIDSDNRFYKIKLMTDILSHEICYWIINESEKVKEWNPSPYKNYDNYLNIEKLPHILNFILYISNFWIVNINKLYDLNNKNLRINIKDIFVSKYCKSNIDNDYYIDNSFLSLNIALNEITDFTEGEIKFDDLNKIKLNQGDSVIYSGKTERTKGSVSDGVKYVLVLLFTI